MLEPVVIFPKPAENISERIDRTNMLKPFVILPKDTENCKETLSNQTNNIENIKIKTEPVEFNLDEALNDIYTTSINSISNDDDSSSDDEDSNESYTGNVLSQIPGEKFISERAQVICQMIEGTASFLPSNPNNEKTALQYFSSYFPSNFFFEISDNMRIPVDPLEIQELFGIHILMNILKYPRYDMYWSPLFRITAITDRMTKERFEILRNSLCIVKDKPLKNFDQPRDSLWKIRPIIESFTNKCGKLTDDGGICIDEQIIPFLLYLNRIKVKAQRKVLRVLFSFVGLAVKNSWLEYKRDSDVMCRNPRDIMDLLEFSLKTAELLLKTGRHLNPLKRMRSISGESSEENCRNAVNQQQPIQILNPAKRQRYSSARQNYNVRYDGIDHWPHMDKKPQRCKLEGCVKKASVRCDKCNLHLCMSSNRNCFKAFHTLNNQITLHQ